jgi:hypothetical protein
MKQESCAAFHVESGVPIIGLGILFLGIVVVPILLGIGTVDCIVIVLFGGFGVFLIWLGLTK